MFIKPRQGSIIVIVPVFSSIAEGDNERLGIVERELLESDAGLGCPVIFEAEIEFYIFLVVVVGLYGIIFKLHSLGFFLDLR